MLSFEAQATQRAEAQAMQEALLAQARKEREKEKEKARESGKPIEAGWGVRMCRCVERISSHKLPSHVRRSRRRSWSFGRSHQTVPLGQFIGARSTTP